MTRLHPDYGLSNELRLAALRDAMRFGVPLAAEINRVSVQSIYNWRKVPELAAQVEEGRK